MLKPNAVPLHKGILPAEDHLHLQRPCSTIAALLVVLLQRAAALAAVTTVSAGEGTLHSAIKTVSHRFSGAGGNTPVVGVIDGGMLPGHHARVQAHSHRRGGSWVLALLCQAASRRGVAGPCHPGDDLRGLGGIHLAVLRNGEAHARPRTIVDGDEAPQEGVAEDEERTLGRRHVEGHQGEGAITLALVHVVFGRQVQDVVPDAEADFWQ
mmetsp:Transcript_65758/g.140679  ORF Transcript_65758/g.140679 Transcript_65758/m.140679 type:complete len:210 (-) Transcript_65758:1084-1713(-)